MKLNNLLPVLLSFFMLTGVACKQDMISDQPPADPLVNDLETVTAGITGVVVNENNIPLSGISVTSGASNAVTDRYGMFRFKNITLSKTNASVKVVHNGYYTAYRSFPATAGRTHNVRIKLIPKINNGSFAAASGGTVNISGGGKLVMPAAAITDALGNSYTGTVNVAMTWINPTSPDLNSVIPGDLRGITTGGQERALETYGMLGVELTGSGGQPLKLASGKTAQLTFPIPAALQASAPASIPLWHFDEATARWKEEGSATKTGTNYVGNVSHFSFWNCDAPWPQITLCMTLQMPSGQALGNTLVRIRRVNVPASSATGITDSLGNLCGIVPQNEPLLMEVTGPCGGVVYAQQIGPFSTSTSLGVLNINIPPANLLTITGNAVNCNNQPVTSGLAFIQLSGGNYLSAPISNGSFTVTMLNCSNNTLNFTVLAIDNQTQVQGNPVAFSGITGTVNTGTLQACGGNAVEFVHLVVDGVPENYNYPVDSISSNAIPVPGFLNYTSGLRTIATRIAANWNRYTMFDFFYNNSLATPARLDSYVYFDSSLLGNSQQIVNYPVNFTMTELGPVNSGFIAGSFTVQLLYLPINITKNIGCTFRVRRR